MVSILSLLHARKEGKDRSIFRDFSGALSWLPAIRGLKASWLRDCAFVFHGPWHTFLLQTYLIVSLNPWKLWHNNLRYLDEKNHSNLKTDLAENTGISPVCWKFCVNTSFKCFSWNMYLYIKPKKGKKFKYWQNLYIFCKTIPSFISSSP